MSISVIRFEDRLDGASNFGIWKERILLSLEEYGLKEFAKKTIIVPVDAQQEEAHKKNDAKARRIIMDGVKDHIVPHLSGLDTTRKMWEAIIKLYQNSNLNRKMVLKEKLRNTKMGKGESVSSYLTKLRQVKDELAVVGDNVDGTELVRIALNGFSKSWDVFVRGIVAREHTPDWDRLWDDFMQEELRLASLSGTSSHQKGEEEENIALRYYFRD
jgi:hypothetical protein